MATNSELATDGQLRALKHPMRHRIWRAVGLEGATVSQLANRLSTNKGNVAHHVKVLVAADLIAPERTRTVRGGTEQYFVATASRVHLPADARASTHALLESVVDELMAARSPLLNHRTIRLTKPQAESLARHLDRLVQELEPASPLEDSYGVLVSVYPRP